jgi:hypothetical protein
MRRLGPKGSVGNVLNAKLSGSSNSRRYISLNTAIQRGLLDEDASRKHRSRGRDNQDEGDEGRNHRPGSDLNDTKDIRSAIHLDKDLGFNAARLASVTIDAKKSSTDFPWSRRKQDYTSHRDGHRTFQGKQDAPYNLPFTTATSEFLYGRSTIIAALKAKRRKFYKLYLHPRAFESESESKENLRDLAAAAHVDLVKLVNSDWLPLMDKVSNDRPHNVCSLFLQIFAAGDIPFAVHYPPISFDSSLSKPIPRKDSSFTDHFSGMHLGSFTVATTSGSEPVGHGPGTFNCRK